MNINQDIKTKRSGRLHHRAASAARLRLLRGAGGLPRLVDGRRRVVDRAPPHEPRPAVEESRPAVELHPAAGAGADRPEDDHGRRTCGSPALVAAGRRVPANRRPVTGPPFHLQPAQPASAVPTGNRSSVSRGKIRESVLCDGRRRFGFTSPDRTFIAQYSVGLVHLIPCWVGPWLSVTGFDL